MKILCFSSFKIRALTIVSKDIGGGGMGRSLGEADFPLETVFEGAPYKCKSDLLEVSKIKSKRVRNFTAIVRFELSGRNHKYVHIKRLFSLVSQR